MKDDMAQRIAQARADLEATREAVMRAEQELRTASTRVLSRDRAVEVTVGPQGELSDLRFLDGKYRTMGASELAATILDAVGQGRAQMAHRVMDTFGPLTTRHQATDEFRGMDIEWNQLFGPLIAATEGASEEQSATDRLRDEIHEDPENG
ncbi:YbaB/EbfC family nucleoid-associated protein [Streptomyces sp. NPDC048279]|uniref:YbaB/EbfC family nucleoid-associated protein n=1 Tax=Streptomyces sp. NPDC048279 TaxID=3154714 RepID=UPI003435AF66